jgi:hypothetical protein
MSKVEACLQNLLLRGLLEKQQGVHEQREDVDMETDTTLIKFVD